MNSANVRFALITMCALVLAACDTEPEDWQTAQDGGSVEAYTAYLDAHPRGAHAEEAKSLLDSLLENIAWDEARADNTGGAYTAYLEAHGDGMHAHEARVRQAGLAFGYLQVSFSVNAPEGMFMMSSPFGAIQQYPPGTGLSLELHSTSGGEYGTSVTIDAIYDRMEEGHGRFVAADGTCLTLGPTASTVSPCSDYEAPLPDPDDPEAVLLYTWISDYN